MVKYRGGKQSELKHYIHHIEAEQFDTYFEPFLGGGATYFHLEPSNAVINDINAKLMQFYLDIRDNFTVAKTQLKELQNQYESNQREYELLKKTYPDQRVVNKNEELYYEMRQKFNYPDNRYLDGVVYYFINKTAYSGMIRYNQQGEYNVPFGRYRNFNTDLIDKKHHELLAKNCILNTDYKQVFDMATPNDIMFLDPPYDCIFSDYGNKQHERGFSEDDHRRLAEDFSHLSCKAIMVIGRTAFIEGLYRKYIVSAYEKSYAVNIRNRFKSVSQHLIIKNF